MGSVYKAWQPSLDRFVAVKLLKAEASQCPESLARFEREARLLARLNHPQIVAIHEYGRRQDQVFIVMEYVDGFDLAVLKQQGRLSTEEMLTLIPSICEGVQYAHEEGVTHRDLKPANIMLDHRGRVKITDFGIARLRSGAPHHTSDLTMTGTSPGTWHYMPPESLRGENSGDPRGDLFSLGVLFYEMLTGELPVVGHSKPPSSLAPIPPLLDKVLFRAMESDPADRYSSAGDLKAAFLKATRNAHRPRLALTRRQAGALTLSVVGLVGGGLWIKQRAGRRTSNERESRSTTAHPQETRPFSSAQTTPHLITFPLRPSPSPSISDGFPRIPEEAPGVVSLVAGRSPQSDPRGHETVHAFTLAAFQDGSVEGWGDNSHGQLDVPEGMGEIQALSTQSKHCLALNRDGRVWAWGFNDAGQCEVPESLSEVVAIETGSRFSLALRKQGSLVQWGELPSSHSPPRRPLVDIAAGAGHALGLDPEGKVISWGKNSAGQSEIPADLPPVKKISANLDTSAALTRDGRIWAWGTRKFRSEPSDSFQEVLVAEDGGLLGKRSSGEWAVLCPLPLWRELNLSAFENLSTLTLSHYHVLGIPRRAKSPQGELL